MMADVAGVAGRLVFLHELIGLRGLGGATVVYSWLLPGSASLVESLVEEAAADGGDRFRGLVMVGEVGDLGSLGCGDLIGEVPDAGRIRSDAGLPVRWFPARAGASS